ncbi:MAG: HAMP domain-containing protein [Cyanobacteria bacterium J06638_28]
MKVFRKSLLAQLVSSFSLLSLVTVSLVSFSAYFLARRSLEESVYDRLKVAAALKEYELSQWLEHQRQEALTLAQAPIVVDTIDEILTAAAEGNTQTETAAALQTYFEDILEVKTDIEAIEILSNGGIVAVSTDPAQLGVYMGLGNTTTYFEPDQQRIVPNIYASTITGTSKLAINFATPILDETGDRQAVVAMTLNLDAISRLMSEKTGLGITGETYLLAEGGFDEIAFVFGIQDEINPENIGDFSNSQGIARALRGQNWQDLDRNYEGTPVVGVYRWLEGKNMVLIAELSQKEAFKPAVDLGRRIFAIGLGAVGVLLVIVYLLAKQLARPVLTITDAAAAIEASQFDALSLNAVLNRPDELGQLARVFKKMADQVYAREAKLKRQVAELRIEIDQARKDREVAAITETDYFLQLTQKAKVLRDKRNA